MILFSLQHNYLSARLLYESFFTPQDMKHFHTRTYQGNGVCAGVLGAPFLPSVAVPTVVVCVDVDVRACVLLRRRGKLPRYTHSPSLPTLLLFMQIQVRNNICLCLICRSLHQKKINRMRPLDVTWMRQITNLHAKVISQLQYFFF